MDLKRLMTEQSRQAAMIAASTPPRPRLAGIMGEGRDVVLEGA